LHPAAAHAFKALQIAVYANCNKKTLTATSSVDTYRPYSVQLSGFLSRYDSTYLPLRNTLSNQRVWNGTTYYLKRGRIPCAVPGTSNHGWGLAIDVAIWDPTILHAVSVRNSAHWDVWNFLQTPHGALYYGFSWENPTVGVDDAHLHFFMGDEVPQGVKDMDAFFAAAGQLPPTT